MSPSDSPEGPTPPEKPTTRGLVAGTLLLSGVVLGGLIGGGIGALVGAFGPLLALGIFLGFAAGTTGVIVRFRDL
jgi:hypothetical protein